MSSRTGPAAVVRAAGPEDAGEIVAFNQAMARETEGKSLDPERLQQGVAAVLEDPARGAYFVAERDGAVVGGLMVTTEWSDWRNGWFWWIQSVYVREEARRQGVYRLLYQKVLADARTRGGVCGLRLYVERENFVARKTYESLGMQESAYRMYEVDFVLGEPL